MMHARPYVSNRYRNEEVDLQPGGSTIVVTTPSDNPFEDERDIDVFTQQSGGMEGGPDPKMRSKKIITKVQQHKTIARGHVPAIRSISPAYKPGGFMPGMGDTASDAGGAFASLINTAGSAVTSKYQADAANAQKSIAASQAQTADASLKKSQADTAFAASIANMGQHTTLIYALLGIGAVVAVGAFLSKKKSSGQVNSSGSTVASLTK